MIDTITRIIETVLRKNNWAVHYKNSPLSKLPVDGDAPIYKINEVGYETFNDAVKIEILNEERNDDTQG